MSESTTPIVLSLFDRTANMVEPWAEAGYKCLCVDIQHKQPSWEGNICRIGQDIRHFKCPATTVIVFAFPPCDHLAISGSHAFKKKGLRKLAEAIELVGAAHDICLQSKAPWFIENPLSTLSSYWRQPDYKFHPWHFSTYATNETYKKNNLFMDIF